MNLLYQLATLPPKLPEAEAISQEISALRRCFGGDVIYVNPNQRSYLYIPRLGFGFHKLKELRQWEAKGQLHHFYNPDPFPFLYLRMLRRPVIYSITCGVRDKQPNIAFFSSLAAIAVADVRSLKRLRAWGLDNVYLVRAGIDTNRFTFSSLPLQSEVRLMVGSAPWTKAQFRTKGIDALLEAAHLDPQLRLVFLWRGVLPDDMMNRVRKMNLEEQIEVIDKQVDVNGILASVHASISLATAPGIIKSYPHSLLDSLAAGKPVLVSRAIPMSDYVEEAGCGVVVETVTATDILTSIETLRQDYEELQRAAQDAGQRDFSQQAMVASFQQVYENVLQKSGGKS